MDEKNDSEEKIDEKENIDVTPKTSVHQQYGLPIRLIWDLNVKILEAKLSKSTAEQNHNYKVYAKLEVGKDAHYQIFETEKLKYNKANETISWKGEEQGVPEKLFFIHNLRKEKIKISLWSEGIFGSYTAASFATMLYSLRKVSQGKTSTGWIKLKNGESGMKDRVVTCQTKLSLSLSHSRQKGYLFLIDFQTSQILFYQSVPTIGDLNPVYNKHDSIPFLMQGKIENDENFQVKLKNGDELLFTISPVDISNLQKRSIKIKDKSKNEVKLDCELSTNIETPLQINIEGTNWNGKLVVVSKIPVWKIEVIKFENSKDLTVANAEWRNMRDLKIEVLAVKEDCAFIISLLVALRRIQTKSDTKSLYF